MLGEESGKGVGCQQDSELRHRGTPHVQQQVVHGPCARIMLVVQKHLAQIRKIHWLQRAIGIPEEYVMELQSLESGALGEGA